MQNSIVKRIQQSQFEILLEIDNICRNNDIPYQLFGGTLLGAVRHKGFIPWDDDIDIAMTREDYDKFLKIASNEINSKYFIQNFLTDKYTYFAFTKIRIKNTTFIEKATQKSKMNQGIFLDIFPLDNVINSDIEIKKHTRRINWLFYQKKIKTMELSLQGNSVFKKLVKIIAFLIIYPTILFKTQEKIIRQIDKACRIHSSKNTNYLGHLTNGVGKNRYKNFLYTKKDFYDNTNLEFNARLFPAPINYDNILKQIYGKYMLLPPEEKRVGSHGILISFDNKVYYKLINNEYIKIGGV
jgi:lipopolysaccharide cholinephosphotransferase